MEVAWKLSGIFNADAQKVYEEIGDTQVTPAEIVEKAKDETSELHKCFEWDDEKAAEKYRLQQARMVINLLVVKTETPEETPARVFQITSERNTYQPSKLFLEQPDEYAALLKRAKGELIAIKNRYKTLSELEDVFCAIDAL